MISEWPVKLMMTAAILQSELSSLLQDAKRKHPEIRAAAERSLSELKSLSVTSEAQLSGDLVRKPGFIEPFVLASKTQNGKLASPSVVCLQRLIAGGAVPRERLRDVLEAFREFSATGLDSQLKVLQSLPAILQTYKADIHADQLFLILEICGILAANKSPVITNTATATFQQLVSTVFESVSSEDQDASVPRSVKLHLDNQVYDVGPRASDAFKIFHDLCVMLEGGRSEHIGSKILPPKFVLEVLESVVANSNKVFRRHLELIHIVRKRAISAIVRILSERQPFDTCVRAMRLLSLLVRNHLDALEEDGEMVLSFMIYLLEPDSGPIWKRILSMEAWKSIYADFKVMRSVFTNFDAVKGRRNILQDHMGAMVRIASEKPGVIGLGHQSTVPQRRSGTVDANDEQASIEALGVAGIVGGAVSAEATVTGISVEWSIPRMPFLEQLDKQSPPAVPETYIFSLVLGLLGIFSENITRFIMPLSVPKEIRNRKSHSSASEDIPETEHSNGPSPSRSSATVSVRRRQVILMNPLEQESHAQWENVKATASLIDACWPAYLASSSTFFYAALDGDHYHGLVRAFQKLTQVSGVMRLNTPRDALLTTLGKAAVPADTFDLAPPPTPKHELGPAGLNGSAAGVSSPGLLSPTTEMPRPSFDTSNATLTTRNLLCLRALLNLGIALGPTLNVAAWTILLSTLQQAELVIKVSLDAKRRRASGGHGNVDDEDKLQTNLGVEITAVQTAANKMFSATIDYPSESFLQLLESLCGMARDTSALQDHVRNLPPSTSEYGFPQMPARPSRRHQPTRSVSTVVSMDKESDQELQFVLEKLPTVVASNKDRLALEAPEESGWNIISQVLRKVVQDTDLATEGRFRGADLLGKISLVTLTLSNTADVKAKADIQRRGLSLLHSQLRPRELVHEMPQGKQSTEKVLHENVLRSLENILAASGEQVIAGWNLVFDVINSIFVLEQDRIVGHGTADFDPHPTGAAVELVRASFQSVQLLGSDFLDRLPPSCISAYIVALHDFGAQTDDLNIALTSTTLFLSVINFLREHMDGPPRIVDRTCLSEHACSKEINVAANALWILAINHLAELALDHRDDIRNAATKLLLGVFENDASSLSAEMWQDCYESIFLRLLNEPYEIEKERQHMEPWVESSIILLEGLIRMLTEQLESLKGSDSLGAIFNGVYASFERLVKTKSLKMDTCVFTSSNSLLTAMGQKGLVTESRLRTAWDLWSSKGRMIISESSSTSMEPNQTALTTYIDCLLQICNLSKSYSDLIDPAVALITCEVVIFRSRHPLYTSDVSRIFPEQEKVLEALNFLYPQFTEHRGEYFRSLLKFVEGPDLTAWVETTVQVKAKCKRPSLVAFSGAVLAFVGKCFGNSDLDAATLTDWAVVEILDCIHDTILCVKGREVNGDPPLWQSATDTSISLIQHLVPIAIKHEKDYDSGIVNKFADQSTKIINAVLQQSPAEHLKHGPVPEVTLKSNEKFDIMAVDQLHKSIVPLLSSDVVDDSIRNSFAEAYFKNSLLFLPFLGDLSAQSDRKLLSRLYNIRNGCIDPPILVSRPEMSYMALRILFSLTAGRDTGRQDLDTAPPNTASTYIPFDCQNLSKAAATYLILRCALPIKSFVADQPLRGLMPVPHNVKQELEYVINNYIDLDSIDDAIPPITSDDDEILTKKDDSSTSALTPVASRSRKGKHHLAHLHPLMLELWSVVKRLGHDNEGLKNVIDRWMREAAMFCGGAADVKIKRNEWWK